MPDRSQTLERKSKLILIRIGEEERQFDAADEHWITQQLNRRRNDGITPCVKVTVHQGDLDLVLATAGCASGPGGGRCPTQQENAIFDLWQSRGLNDSGFSAGNLVAFIEQLKRNL